LIRDNCDEFILFVEECSFDGGIDIFERIADVNWNKPNSDPDIRITRMSSYGPQTPGGEYHGEFDIGNITFWFHLESSNIRGDVMHSWEMHE